MATATFRADVLIFARQARTMNLTGSPKVPSADAFGRRARRPQPAGTRSHRRQVGCALWLGVGSYWCSWRRCPPAAVATRGVPVGGQEHSAAYQKHDYPKATLATVVASGSDNVECWITPVAVTGCGKSSAAAVAKVVLDPRGHVKSTRFVPDPCPPGSKASRIIAAPPPTDAEDLEIAGRMRDTSRTRAGASARKHTPGAYARCK